MQKLYQFIRGSHESPTDDMSPTPILVLSERRSQNGMCGNGVGYLRANRERYGLSNDKIWFAVTMFTRLSVIIYPNSDLLRANMSAIKTRSM